ncbi:FixH family protein [Halalkalibacter okhensis]|uniref:YtkA-like domain-containing protein n=1 Tax=Halalkalibacter okhensis TaxID=333138 RepID=A0A0B0IIG3_9BACI|nr:FixH family protein [Halalkalibacter okhensis]KHF40677.1 hypothetical protein LQ50_07700 [Halalkalibacter okhensis]
MKKIIEATALVVLLSMLSACGQAEEEQGSVEVDELTAIEVELEFPEFAEVGEVVTFNSSVTQGDDLVEDANEVIYEIWLEGQKEDSKMIEADVQNGHIYSLDHTFEEMGLYHVQTHVTARGMHRMPTGQIQIGDDNGDTEDHSHEQEHEDHHDHHHYDVDIETEVKDDTLVVHIVVEGQKYEQGNVTLEMWQEDEDVRKWLDLSEIGDGVYELDDLEGLSGQYSVIVHIQDDELHEHVHAELTF